jgi:CDP-diacylglycerol--serine O-phosphatidyltransferase
VTPDIEQPLAGETPVRRARFSRRESDLDQRTVRRGMYILPSAFTIANIGAGFYAILQTMQGSNVQTSRFDNAAIAIGFAILFDGLDGRIARMTNTTSEFGKELDSLADAITFGVAPALLAYAWGFSQLSSLPIDSELHHKIVGVGAVVCFAFLICGVSRLARFNITKNPQPKNPGRAGRKYFVGMPIPAGAGVIASVVHFFEGMPVFAWWLALLWAALISACAFLMVSTWRFYSGKDINLKQRHPFYGITLIAIVIAIVILFHHEALLSLALGYMLSGVLFRLTYAMRRKPPVAA